MSLGLARRKELQKRRTQRLWMFIKLIIILTIIGGSGYFAFDTGQKIALRSMEYNKDNFEQQATELENIRIKLGNTEASLSKLQSLLPTKDIQDLLLVINTKATDGISPKRMASLIAGLTKDETCSDQSQAKRIVISTPVSQQTNSSVSFDRGVITVSGKGSPTLNENGNPEAWFDVAKPVTITFTLPGGETQSAEGILPVFHSVVVKDKEYRFTITSGRRSFADITVRTCGM